MVQDEAGQRARLSDGDQCSLARGGREGAAEGGVSLGVVEAGAGIDRNFRIADHRLTIPEPLSISCQGKLPVCNPKAFAWQVS